MKCLTLYLRSEIWHHPRHALLLPDLVAPSHRAAPPVQALGVSPWTMSKASAGTGFPVTPKSCSHRPLCLSHPSTLRPPRSQPTAASPPLGSPPLCSSCPGISVLCGSNQVMCLTAQLCVSGDSSRPYSSLPSSPTQALAHGRCWVREGTQSEWMS